LSPNQESSAYDFSEKGKKVKGECKEMATDSSRSGVRHFWYLS